MPGVVGNWECKRTVTGGSHEATRLFIVRTSLRYPPPFRELPLREILFSLRKEGNPMMLPLLLEADARGEVLGQLCALAQSRKDGVVVFREGIFPCRPRCAGAA